MVRWQFWCVLCVLAKLHTTFKWKDIISVFSVLQGSAETLIRWGGKIYHLQIACCLLNILPKIIKIQQCLLDLQRKMSGVFFIETQCIYAIQKWFLRELTPKMGNGNNRTPKGTSLCGNTLYDAKLIKVGKAVVKISQFFNFQDGGCPPYWKFYYSVSFFIYYCHFSI